MERNEIIVYSHMMKTAGTALAKLFIYQFGKSYHQTPGGLSLNSIPFTDEDFQKELNRSKRELKCISGHSLKPWYDFTCFGKRLKWVTFTRNPIDRFISHYLHDKYYRPSHFKHVSGNKSIKDWNKKYNEGNYQVRFISGEANLEKAIDIIENKFFFVGFQEDFNSSISFLSESLCLKNFPPNIQRTNKGKASSIEKDRILLDFQPYIKEKNQLDLLFYNYLIKNKKRLQRREALKCQNEKKKIAFVDKLRYSFNFWQYHIYRQRNLKTEKINKKNVRHFIRRWF